ncbi:MAG: PilZ domain-containing protein [Planctomycetota bacterium]
MLSKLKCKRSHYRVPLQVTGPITVLHHDGSESPPVGEGQILDMSRGGCCLGFKHVESEELEVNCQLHMVLPLGTGEPFHLKGTVVWLKGGGEGICKIGVQFSPLSREVRRKIDQFLGAPGEHVEVEFARGYRRSLVWRRARAALLVIVAIVLGLGVVMAISVLDQRMHEEQTVNQMRGTPKDKGALDPALEDLLKTYGEKELKERMKPRR